MGSHVLNNMFLIPQQLLNNSYGLIKKIFKFFVMKKPHMNFACNMQQ